MTWATLGTMALPFHLQRTGVQARTDLARHSHEMTTGQVQSVTRHLRGDIGALQAIENRLMRIGQYDNTLKQAVTSFDTAQAALDKVARTGQDLAVKLVLTAEASAGPAARGVAVQAARSTLGETIAAMAVSVAGRSIFSGVQSDRAPLVKPDVLLGALGAEVAGMTAAADVFAALDAWFMSPGTDFATTAYRGGAPVAGGVMDDGTAVPELPTAEDPAIRRQLMYAAMVVLLDDGAITLAPDQERAVLQRAMTGLMENAERMAGLQSRVGIAQEVLERQQLRLSLESDRLELLRSDKIGVDPYKAATQLEQSRVQLESIYAVTARLTRLSLTEYLR
ncbi:flagellin [Pararhodobacter sp. SW119]|uniref:flagellin n=1 Tax=Pararhodobacter sp. SW119 TaxID=2780075 RepID=UPI001ADFC061|nr:flagellin [Pararhodobacter sp. SW119]